MDVHHSTIKRTRFANASADRLSSLHDDILIRIISHLPFPFAVVTACLSTRWRGLWTLLTCININRLKREASLEFFTTIDHLLRRITSPCIDSFSVMLDRMSCFLTPLPSIDSWIESLTNNRNNVRKLKVILPHFLGIRLPVLQRFSLQARMLVSLKCSRLCCDMQLPSDVDFSLPNLRKLSLGFEATNNINEWLKKLIKGCPLLVKLTLRCIWNKRSDTYIECSNQNLRRLKIDLPLSSRHHKFVINVPKLEYLAVRGQNYSTFCFDKVPTALREARITISGHRDASSDEENKLWSRFYEGVSNAKVLVLDGYGQHLSTVFRYATDLTIDVRKPIDFQTVLSFLERCPVLDFLTLRFCQLYGDDEQWELPKPGVALQTVLQRIHIEIYVDPYYLKLSTNFEVVQYLLSNSVNLSHFKYDLTKSKDWRNKGAEALQKRELELCKRLYMCPMASTTCEVEFVGKFIKMSQKAGSKAWSENREVSDSAIPGHFIQLI